MDPALESLTKKLAKLATYYDHTGEWPVKSLEHLTDAGAWTWVIPRQFGGLGLDPFLQTQGYEAVAAGCMSTLLILTQRDGAAEFIAQSNNEPLKSDLLPRLVRHETMISLGISQLTTSHQTGRPALTARPDGSSFKLHGFSPWITGARECQYLVIGAVLPDERQLLLCVPTDLKGVVIDPPMQLMALQSSQTCEVHFKDVVVDEQYVLRGPGERILASRSTVKPLVVATAGIGLAGTMVRLIQSLVAKSQPAAEPGAASSPLVEMADELTARYQALRDRLMTFAASLLDPAQDVPKTEIRVGVNDLLVRLAAGLLIYSKGSGLLRQRDAQRLVREAMFFLVWSAPEDVRAQTLARLLDRPDPQIRSMTR
ncbi:MAG TPA: acyl-CoA dehydrogenase family protein [Phycisphaerae bacterium]|nr:acyl-CoA dehydrogenase family protein [Phycisphaerae bacterium]